jgi:hypothetical protein
MKYQYIEAFPVILFWNQTDKSLICRHNVRTVRELLISFLIIVFHIAQTWLVNRNIALRDGGPIIFAKGYTTQWDKIRIYLSFIFFLGIYYWCWYPNIISIEHSKECPWLQSIFLWYSFTAFGTMVSFYKKNTLCVHSRKIKVYYYIDTFHHET